MVAVTPLMSVVITPEFAEIEEELMMDVEEETPLILEVSVLTAEARPLLFTKLAVVVAVLPFMILVKVKELVEVETERVLEVDDATRLVRSVDVATPLMVVVRVVPFVARALEVITEVVAVRPLIVVESVLPVTDWVKELIIEAKVEDTPLTIVWKRLTEDEAVLEVIILVVPIDPPRLEVSVFREEERELPVVRLVILALVEVALVATKLVVVALVAVRLVKIAVTAVSSVAKKVVDVALVEVSAVILVVANVEVPVVESVPPTLVFPVVVRDVNVGVGLTEIVEVPLKAILLPASKYDTGVL